MLTLRRPSISIPAQTDLNALYARTQEALRGLAGDYGRGEISTRQFGDRAAALLEDAHTEAVVMGRGRAGDDVPAEADDRKFAEHVVDEESEFLAHFVGDIEQGRYGDGETLDLEAVKNRAGLYAYRLTGTANQGFVLASEAESWDWILGSNDPCPDCPRLAAASPYTGADIPTPGQNLTACVFRCKCSLRRSDGMLGFTVPD